MTKEKFYYFIDIYGSKKYFFTLRSAYENAAKYQRENMLYGKPLVFNWEGILVWRNGKIRN